MEKAYYWWCTTECLMSSLGTNCRDRTKKAKSLGNLMWAHAISRKISSCTATWSRKAWETKAYLFSIFWSSWKEGLDVLIPDIFSLSPVWPFGLWVIMLKTLSILFVVLFLSIQIKYFSIHVFLRTIPKLLLILFYNNFFFEAYFIII